ncbi:MAG: hypothetical protein ABIN67_18345 [Ferruginibacter sp.]
MHLNDHIQVRGCITQEKYIKGRSVAEVERILGFKTGRLKTGYVIAALEQIPNNDDFDLLGYSQVAGHHFGPEATKGLDVIKLKNMVRQNVFTMAGVDRLVKVIPNTPHQGYMSNDEQYPPGQGVPQWKLVKPIYAKVIAVIPAV